MQAVVTTEGEWGRKENEDDDNVRHVELFLCDSSFCSLSCRYLRQPFTGRNHLFTWKNPRRCVKRSNGREDVDGANYEVEIMFWISAIIRYLILRSCSPPESHRLPSCHLTLISCRRHKKNCRKS